MPISNYPFTPIATGLSRPMLWIRITNPHRPEIPPIEFHALVDTGADDCVFPADAALALGHDLTTVPPKIINGVNASSYAYPHTSRIDILGMNPSDCMPTTDILYTIIDTPIDYLINCQNFILGTRNFLRNFVLTIDYPNQRFSIQNNSNHI